MADASWRVVETHRLTRTQFERWFVNRDVSLVIMEACREFGIAIPTAARTSIEAISRVLAEPATAVPDLIRAQPSCWWQKSACWKRALPSWSGNWQP